MSAKEKVSKNREKSESAVNQDNFNSISKCNIMLFENEG